MNNIVCSCVLTPHENGNLPSKYPRLQLLRVLKKGSGKPTRSQRGSSRYKTVGGKVFLLDPSFYFSANHTWSTFIQACVLTRTCSSSSRGSVRAGPKMAALSRKVLALYSAVFFFFCHRNINNTPPLLCILPRECILPYIGLSWRCITHTFFQSCCPDCDDVTAHGRSPRLTARAIHHRSTWNSGRRNV